MPKTRAQSSAEDKLETLPPKGKVEKLKKRHVLEDNSDTSVDDSPPPRSRWATPLSPTKLSPKGKMMEIGTGKRVQAEDSAATASKNKPAEGQPDEPEAHQQPSPAKRKPGRPPGKLNKPAALVKSQRERARAEEEVGAQGGSARQPAQLQMEHSEASLRAYTKEQYERRKRAEDALVKEAERSGRFVDLAVHSFVAAMPPSRLVVPEGVPVNFVRRQIQYRVVEAGGMLSADAIELQLKDNCGQMVTAISFNSRGREMTISDYGLVPGPPGSQHHIWAIFVDDTDAKIQRDATDRILQPTGASNLARSPPPASVVAYEAALSPAREAPQAAASPLEEQARQDAAVRHDQQMQDALASLSPSKKRKNGRNTRWSAEETELLIDSVIVRGTGSWADILATHRATFHPTRSSVDLKDKWRNLVKGAQKPADAETRTQVLTREQVVKILEFLHKDDE